MGRDIFAQTGLDPYRAEELQPGAAVKTDAEIEQWIRAQVRDDLSPGRHLQDGPRQTRWRWSTTLRVRGMDGLRVVDASVMPTLSAATPTRRPS